MFKIVPFNSSHADHVQGLVLKIQREEFGFPITLEDQPDLQAVDKFFRNGKGNFWVAIVGGQVVGTIGLADIGNQQFALRKMFVERSCRGAEAGVASILLNSAFSWAHQCGYKEILLGTTDK